MAKTSTVLLESDWTTRESDWACISRIYARTLEFAGFSVGLVGGPAGQAAEPGAYQEVSHLLQRPAQWNSYVYGMPYYGQPFVDALKAIAKHSQVPSVVLTSLNGLSVPATAAQAVNAIEGLCTPSQANAEAFVASGVHRDKVFHIPPAFFPNDPYLGLADLSRKRGPVRFYAVGTWELRKGLDRLVRAFMYAFRPGEAHLTLKLIGFPWPTSFLSPEFLAVDEIGNNPQLRAAGWSFESWQANVTLLRNAMASEEFLGLHANNDVYVSCALSESVDFQSFRAKLAGKRLVATASGAAQEYLGSEDVLIPSSGEFTAPVPYEKARWLDYDLAALVAALQQAAQTSGSSRTSPAKFNWPRDSFRVNVVSKKVAKMFEKVWSS